MTVNYKKSFLWYEKNWAFSIMSSQSIGWVAFAWFLSIHAVKFVDSFGGSIDESSWIFHPKWWFLSTHCACWGLSANAQAEICGKPEKNCAWVKHFFTSFLPLLCGCFQTSEHQDPEDLRLFCVKLYPLIFRDCTYNKIHSKPWLRILVNQWFHGSRHFFLHLTRPRSEAEAIGWGWTDGIFPDDFHRVLPSQVGRKFPVFLMLSVSPWFYGLLFCSRSLWTRHMKQKHTKHTVATCKVTGWYR